MAFTKQLLNGPTSFINALNSANFGDNSDWWFPSPKEMDSIVNYDIHLRGQSSMLLWRLTVNGGIDKGAGARML
ncbi:MAG: hypothetical protein HY881_15965 [Deltaproteobacteria bacterium]|nr:hypothetical protein [Deltaproteobacteria bacterium]